MCAEFIKKTLTRDAIQPNMDDYASACRRFSWESAKTLLDGLPGGGLNIAYEAIDRHADGKKSAQRALCWLDKQGKRHDFTYGDLKKQTNRFANVLKDLGMMKGDRLFSLCGRIPALYIAVLGTLKNGSVYCPLFSAFGPEPIQSRLSIGESKALVTTSQLYKRKIAKLRDQLPRLEYILIADLAPEDPSPPGTHNLNALMSSASAEFEIPPTGEEDLALLHFTSGTTGRPKGAMHVHKAVLAHIVTGRFALELHESDVFWCTADPGWVTGTSYGIIAPLALGATMLVDEQEFDAERWYKILQDEKVSVWYTAPTAIRMMMRLGTELVQNYHFSQLRFMASVGEPLNSEAVIWSNEAFGRPFHDNWWQTETGGIMISNYANMDIKPGSMGRPLPGIEAAIATKTASGTLEFIDQPGQQGHLVLKKGWPSMFRGYLHEEERYRKCFVGDWYLTGDLARRDEDGYFWFVGRADDLIKTSGHLIGPFEVEDVLMTHPAVAEAGVIGKPDPVALEVVKAFVSLKPGFEPDEDLRKQLMAHARKRLGAVVAPKEIEFRKKLPKTRSGKILRRLLKAQESGLPEGDVSTLENEE